jgi:single-stranded-DNA-specific exonuclease
VGEPRFEIPECQPSAVEGLRHALGVSGVLAQVLVRRGLAEPARARAFLAADESYPYTAFAGIEEALATIRRHVDARARITVHGDYDVDGVCSTAVLVRTLRRMGADVDWYLPDRESDGYGLNMDTIARLAARGTKLLVTADCAITAVDEVAGARGLGMDVVVSDHHSVRADGVLPDAPIVHPTVCDYPYAQLCATAVAYKLAEGLTGREPIEDLDLVALATIADVVPLLGENRALVRRGLRALAGTGKLGLRALMAVARVDPSRVNERTVAFGLAPRLNAAGRLYRADASLELILTEDKVRAAQVAQELDRINHERRGAEQAIRHEAEAQIAALSPGSDPDPGADTGPGTVAGEVPRALVLAAEGWNVGVIGIVASRLAETHHRPVVLIALDGDRGRGSGRAGCEAFDLLAGLTACAEHLSRYGGHRAAAGLEIKRERVAAFASALDGYARAVLTDTDTAPVERVDAVVDGSELGMELAEELQALAPFGQGNRPVALMLRDATFADVRPMGEGKHARFTVHARGGRARAVAFNTGAGLPVADGELAQATFALEVNEWNGVSEPRLVLRQACAASAPRIEDRRATSISARRGEPAPKVEPLPAVAPKPEAEPQELVLFS